MEDIYSGEKYISQNIINVNKNYYSLYVMDLGETFVWQILETNDDRGAPVVVAEGEEKELNTAIQEACAMRYQIKQGDKRNG